ncbi:MAG: hypothetical protein ISS15_17240 [Alphaproteobacteria bacterium]|nr:hypothetical protein [Alphaproteobacteria bacterium]MBL6937767.1 hypothetical protein [Alphaproteobacteria bacterium]MBL7099407.1 hypothetical protein [Alphaproteobacteria bacterium]
MISEFLPYLGPALALMFIFRRGLKPRRVKVNSLWRTPIIYGVLAFLTLSRSHAPSLVALSSYALATVAGGALGWFTAQHAELTLDKENGTIMSQPTRIGTAITAAAFILKFAIDFYMNGAPGNGAPNLHPFAIRHAAGINVFGNALLLLAVARTFGNTAHMWIRTRPLVELLAKHRANSTPPAPPPTST